MSNLGGVFSQENTPEGRTETHKSSFFPYEQVSGRNGDHEWLRMTSASILCDLVWKVQKSHAANREGSFKYNKFIHCGKLISHSGEDSRSSWSPMSHNLVIHYANLSCCHTTKLKVKWGEGEHSVINIENRKKQNWDFSEMEGGLCHVKEPIDCTIKHVISNHLIYEGKVAG